MADYEVFAPFLIAIMMGIGALCIFIWGVLSGAFFGSDKASQNFYHAEMENDGNTRQAGR